MTAYDDENEVFCKLAQQFSAYGIFFSYGRHLYIWFLVFPQAIESFAQLVSMPIEMLKIFVSWTETSQFKPFETSTINCKIGYYQVYYKNESKNGTDASVITQWRFLMR